MTFLHSNNSTRRHAARWSLPAALALALAGPAQADVVTDWNITATSVAPRFGGPQQQARVLAMTHIAIHDALNSIDRRYQPYNVVRPASANATADAAVAGAARKVLLQLLAPLPASTAKTAAINSVNAQFDTTVGPGAPDANEMSGIAAGEAAATSILTDRIGDGSQIPNPVYAAPLLAGVYQPTPSTADPDNPAVITPQNVAWGQVTPFALNHARQFRVKPGRLFYLRGLWYAHQYNQVRLVGDALVRGTLPDSEPSNIARYWQGGGSNWNLSARIIVSGLGLDRWEHARLFALLNMAEADALIANQYNKYLYRYWRPVTAIRWSNDGNPMTPNVANWTPFLVTPPYPDYPCALPTATGASTEVLRRFFGTDDIAFSRSFAAPPVPLPPPLIALPGKILVRAFSSLSQAAAESVDARVYAGIHFREGCVAGRRQGEQIGRFVIQHYLVPTRVRH